MRRLINLIESRQMSKAVTRKELAARCPGIDADLAAVDGWMKGPVVYLLAIEPMTRFAGRAQDMLATYPTFPKERVRTNRIIKTVQSGAIPWPIFIDAVDDFIMEGRHRVVAFHILGMTTMETIYVTDATPDPTTPRR